MKPSPSHITMPVNPFKDCQGHSWQSVLQRDQDFNSRHNLFQTRDLYSPICYGPDYASVYPNSGYETRFCDCESLYPGFCLLQLTSYDYPPQELLANGIATGAAITMPPKAGTESTVPLICSLCPKNPKFSDISHLLTHISSKSHLANIFKLKIRAQGEQEAKDKLDTFELWYNDNNLNALLSERMVMKDQKKANKEKKNKTSNTSKKSTKKEEPADTSVLDTTPVYRAPVPRMHLWSTIASKRHSTPAEDEWITDNLYETPAARRPVPNFAETPKADTIDPKLKTPTNPTTKTYAKSGDVASDSAQLKGVLWPGMDIFDSAPPEMKRMRNQRKDSNVMKQMIATSAEIEPAEISYFADGAFRSSRDIFGPLSGDENSPVKEPTPKRKRKPRKPTLKDVSVNIPRARSSREKNTIATRSPKKQYPASHGPAPTGAFFMNSVPAANPLALASSSIFGHSFAPTTDEDEELKMTVGDPKKKRVFGVFQDACGESPSGQTESSLEDHRFDLPNHGLPLYHKSATSISHTSPTPAPKSVSGRSVGKENMQFATQSQMLAQQSAAYASHAYPPQVFHNPSFNPLYSHAFANSFGFGSHHQNNLDDIKPLVGLTPGFYQNFKPSANAICASKPKDKSEKNNIGSQPGTRGN